MSCVVFYFPRFIAVGQALRATPAKQFFVNNKKTFKSLQEVSGIMYIASISSHCWKLLCFRSSMRIILASKFHTVLTTIACFSFVSLSSLDSSGTHSVMHSPKDLELNSHTVYSFSVFYHLSTSEVSNCS